MIVFSLIGTLPIFLNPTILSATTVSGTMVLGLAPVFIFWNKKVHPIAFHLSVGVGLIVGIALATGYWPASWLFSEGKYADLLSANIIGTAGSFAAFGLGSLLHPNSSS